MVADVAAGNVYTQHSWSALKVQPRRLADDAWKARELGRFADGTYVSLPWADLPKRDATAHHYAHVSTVDGAKIAYTQDAAKGAGDIQTRVKPGKYLQQFYGDVFDVPTIARMSAEFSTQFGESLSLQFADTEDEIERVYVNGPSSCMSKPADHYASSIHPCRVYAAGDLAVAYMVRNSEITARVLTWPAKKIYGRIYGDETRISDLLDEAGFTEGDLDGARMLRIVEGRGFVCPYIDGATSAGDNGDHLVLGGRGVEGGNTNGLSASTYCCDSCGCEVDEDDCQSDDNGNSYCDCCYGERFGYCERNEEECERDTMEEVHTTSRHSGRRRTQYWGENAIANHATRCEATGDLYDDDLIVTLADGTAWNIDYFEENGFTCEGDGECHALSDLVQLKDGTMWSQDYFADNGVTVDDEHYAKGDEPKADGDEEPQVTAQIEMPLTVSVAA